MRLDFSLFVQHEKENKSGSGSPHKAPSSSRRRKSSAAGFRGRRKYYCRLSYFFALHFFHLILILYTLISIKHNNLLSLTNKMIFN